MIRKCVVQLCVAALSLGLAVILLVGCNQENTVTRVEYTSPSPNGRIESYQIEDAELALDSLATIHDRYFSQSTHKVLLNDLRNHYIYDSTGMYHHTIILSPLTTKYWLFDLAYDSSDQITQYRAIYLPSLTENIFTAIVYSRSTREFTNINLPRVAAEPDSGMDAYYIKHCILDIREILNAIGRYKAVHTFDPPSIGYLIVNGFLDDSVIHRTEWNYIMYGANPYSQIQAISGGTCSFGAGKTITWSASNAEFYGWGM